MSEQALSQPVVEQNQALTRLLRRSQVWDPMVSTLTASETTGVLSDILLWNVSSDPREKAHNKRKLTVCLPLWGSSKNVAAPEVVR